MFCDEEAVRVCDEACSSESGVRDGERDDFCESMSDEVEQHSEHSAIVR